MQAALYKDNELCGYLDIIWSCQGLPKELQGSINHYCHWFLLYSFLGVGCFFFFFFHWSGSQFCHDLVTCITSSSVLKVVSVMDLCLLPARARKALLQFKWIKKTCKTTWLFIYIYEYENKMCVYLKADRKSRQVMKHTVLKSPHQPLLRVEEADRAEWIW